jgi:hypothetical protein
MGHNFPYPNREQERAERRDQQIANAVAIMAIVMGLIVIAFAVLTPAP